MKPLGCAILLAAVSLIGCETANEIGRAVTAPVRYVFHEPEATPIPNASDVTSPGRPMPVASPTPRLASRRGSTSSRRRSPSASPSKIGSSPTPAASQFPVAKAVPGKPGLVFNPFDSHGGYIDVSGYAPGSKVKDPGTQKIFIVP